MVSATPIGGEIQNSSMDEQARRRVRALEIRALLDNGQRVTLDEYRSYLSNTVECILRQEIAPGVRKIAKGGDVAGAILDAAFGLASIVVRSRVTDYENRLQLDDRITALEKAVKPRHRAKAVTRGADAAD